MGFETDSRDSRFVEEGYLNYFPMGFETYLKPKEPIKRVRFELFPYGIWNNLRRASAQACLSAFELFPYGIWN